MVTIEVYDGVNTPVEGTFSVMVVASNVKPTVSALGIGADSETTPSTEDVLKLAAKLYVGRGASTVTVSSVIYDFGDTEGSAGDDLTFHPAVGNAGGDDDIVSVSLVAKGSKPDTWDITLMPKEAGHQNVEVVVKDKFGAPADTKWMFTVLVNTKPSVKVSLPDRTVSMGTTDDPASMIAIPTYFTVAEKDPMQPMVRIYDAIPSVLESANLHGSIKGSYRRSNSTS